MSSSRSTSPEDFEEYKVEVFKPLNDSPKSPEDDPGEWVYADDSGEEDNLRQLAEDILRYDDALASILAGTVSGEVPTGELLRRVCAWQAANGGGHKRSGVAVPPQPWLA